MFEQVKIFIRRYSTMTVIFGAFGMMILICGLSGLGLYFYTPENVDEVTPSPILNVVDELTSTPYVPTLTPTIMPTATENLPPSPLPGMIGVGSTVQIFGTEGDALNIRTGPGLDTQVIFLALESEIFEIGDGPEIVDGITWWYLVTPLDSGRSGWAAANYLSLIPNP